jgi:ribosome biogenesis GTPase / thiamine phosphate phosphatase
LVALDGENTTRVAQLRRVRGRRFMPVPGDVAFVQLLSDGGAVIERLAPRGRTLTRRTVEGKTKTIAANIDTLATVTSLADPSPQRVLLDRLIAFAELEGVAALVVLTKTDLVAPVEVEHYRRIYEPLGYTVLGTTPKFGGGIAELRQALTGRRSLLCGVSGVGKSSIFRRLVGAGEVGEISRSRSGRHTTGAARLCRLDDGFLIDSPGIREFGLGPISPHELTEAFAEIRQAARACRFRDCAHLREPGCAVRHGLERGEIDPGRYASYRQILRAEPLHAIVP